jgi:hypothetical protein
VVVNKEVYMENSEAKGMCFEKVEEKQWLYYSDKPS